MELYEFVNRQFGKGCNGCPFMGKGNECDWGDGYTKMDEHGECPGTIEENEDLQDAVFNG